jgi:DNA-binding response OmpR family regulator
MDGKKILIIDDDYNGSKIVRESLKKSGFDVSYAYDAEESLEKLKASKPDIILLDLVLGEESGFKVAQSLKDNPEYANIPIIAISLKKENIDKHIAAKVGIIDYLEKPLDIEKLTFRIKDLLNIK